LNRRTVDETHSNGDASPFLPGTLYEYRRTDGSSARQARYWPSAAQYYRFILQRSQAQHADQPGGDFSFTPHTAAMAIASSADGKEHKQ
jgi:hypothetical protein